jgi:transposase
MPKKSKRITKLTPETLKELDQEALVSIVMKLYEQNVQLSEQLQAHINEKYGRKTERHEDAGQLRIFQLPDEKSAEDAQDESEPTAASRKKPGHTRNPMPSHLNSEKIRRQPTQDELICKCGAHRQKVNEVVRNKRFECIPAVLYVEEIIDTIWQCPACRDTVVVAASPPEPIPDGKAGPRLLCKIAEDRWLGHSPYHRQEQAFARHGIDIPRSTMCGWMGALAAIFRRIYEGMKAELLKSEIIATDDTPVKVQDRTKKSNIKRGHEWIFMGDSAHPVNLFHYTQGRSRAGPRKFIPGFKGFLQGDCFSGNRALCAETGATLVACRAHDRRYYKKAKANNKQLCDQMLDWYRELFEIEQSARDLHLNKHDVVSMRQQEAVPILDKMKAWLDQQIISALPASSFGKAVGYSLNNWAELNNYLLDGELRIDNNLAEQEMKRFATGRKNWYFYGSDEAGEHASIMLSLFSTCLRNGVEPGAYLLDALQRLTANPDCDIKPLLPYRWNPESKNAEIEGITTAPEIAFSSANR